MGRKAKTTTEQRETVFIGLHVPVAVHKQLLGLAESDRRTLSQMAKILLEEAIEAKLSQMAAK